MKYSKIYSVIVIFLLCFGCNPAQNCNNNYVSNYLIDYANDREYNYCYLLEMSLEGDLNSIKEISLLKFSDGMTYEHGAVIIEIINKVSESKFLEAISGFNENEKTRIESYIYAGFDITQNPNFKDVSLEDSLKEVYKYFNSNGTE